MGHVYPRETGGTKGAQGAHLRWPSGSAVNHFLSKKNAFGMCRLHWVVKIRCPSCHISFSKTHKNPTGLTASVTSHGGRRLLKTRIWRFSCLSGLQKALLTCAFFVLRCPKKRTHFSKLDFEQLDKSYPAQPKMQLDVIYAVVPPRFLTGL